MKIERIWAMPNKWTFTIKPIKELLIEEVRMGIWVDPFCGQHSVCDYDFRNDLNPEIPAKYHMDAIEFLKIFKDESIDGVLLDPPYSITQASQCYKSFGKDLLEVSPGNMKYWSTLKNESARILKIGGKVICFGWNSMGLGLKRGFEMTRILLIPHGGSKNDTICTVEIKREGND